MWPFKRAPRENPADLYRLLAALEVRLERIERAQRDIAADWDSTYDKFAMLLKRWAKREKAASAPPDNGPGRRDLVSLKLGD